jgi:23S rRNA (adenine2503-C2)-methyltransferase
MRHVTVSTCGLTDKMKQLADEDLQITLAISLHAPDDETRAKIMPVTKKYPVDDLIKAADEYATRTKRRVTFEYALIKGVNDSPEAAELLASKIKGILCHVNLIPINDVPGTGFERSPDYAVDKFETILASRGVEVTRRRELGTDISAACGQLRKNEG